MYFVSCNKPYHIVFKLSMAALNLLICQHERCIYYLKNLSKTEQIQPFHTKEISYMLQNTETLYSITNFK